MVDSSHFLFLVIGAVFVYVRAASMLLSRYVLGKHSSASPACSDGCHCPAPSVPTPSRWCRWHNRIIYTAAILGLVMLAWSFAEPYFPEVVHVSLRSPKITAPVRIVQISDLHCDPTIRLENRLPEIIAAQKPDVIVFTGDAINSPDGWPVFQACMQKLSAIAPTFGVKGNWEAWWFKDIDIFSETGVRELDGNAQTLTLNGQAISFSGTAVTHEGRITQALANMPKDTFRIFLHHFPAMVGQVSGQVDLHLSGDTHGGQITLPGLGALIRIKRSDGVYYPAGLSTIHGTALYVNRGIGMEGGHVPRVRFLCRPEITVIDLLPPHDTSMTK